MFFKRPKTSEPYAKLIEELAVEKHTYYYNYNLKESRIGQQLLAATPQEQRGFVLAAVEWFKHAKRKTEDHAPWLIRSAMLGLLRRRLPLEHDDISVLLDWSIRQSDNYWRAPSQMIKIVDDFLKGHELTPSMVGQIEQLIAQLESGYSTAETRKWTVRLKELSGQTSSRFPLVAGEAWSDAAVSDLEGLEVAQKSHWLKLLNICTKASGSVPTAKWLKTSEPLLNEVGYPQFREAVLKWFPFVDKPRTQRIESWSQYQPDPNNLIEPVNADIIRALVWLCAQREDTDVARALTALAISAYRKVPAVGPRCIRVGNACVWALGEMPGTESVGQLSLLKVKVKGGTPQKMIEKALATAAARIGLPPDEIEEMSVPTYGLQEVGEGHKQFAEFTAELRITGTSTADLRWRKPDGKRQSSVPQAVREQHAEALKELNQAVKDIRKMVPAQAVRIESLYLAQKRWALSTWQERYLSHPLIGTLARRLIWRFTSTVQTASGVWHGDQVIGSDGHRLDWLDQATSVELWHPLHEPSDTVIRWRDWLAEHEIQQPFKQAHREIYLLTDAETATGVYSNRFAGHVIKQHQFNALCGVRGWRNKLRLMVDDVYPPAIRAMPAWDLRAEFWIEGIGENYGTDTTEAGSYLYLATDQVRFYQINALQHQAHAGGGGYHAGALDPNSVNEPLLLELVPTLVFSEIMRDVDMFVGVASVANDPTWSDGGPGGRYQDYWTSYSFGDLSETAKTRRQVLERLIPRLKIADRCKLVDKFLVVRGDVRTYKIHLGSSNILMEPNDQYLCIVPARGQATEGLTGKMFLPFEGDNTLAIILSKAFLLAQDWNIKDPVILRQIGASS